MGCCTFVSGVTITVVVPSSVSTVRLFPERRVITPLPFTLSEARADPKLKRHTAKRLTEIPILLLVINPPSTFMCSARAIRRLLLLSRDFIEGGRCAELAKVTGGNNIPEGAEIGWI